MVETNPIKCLKNCGQSVWLDNINRKMLASGELGDMIALGLLGMTSNPSIFDKAISGSADYDELITGMKGKSSFEIYDELTVKDVREAADNFLGVYETSHGVDGYVSLEVNPHLSRDTQKTIEEAQRLAEKASRPNIMFKIPATDEGFPAIKQLISGGLNINATLIFSVEQYLKTAHAFVEGLKSFAGSGGDVKRVASVASVFVSRVDTMTDKLIEEKLKNKTNERLAALRGRAAVANCKLIYQEYLRVFSSQEWMKLFGNGARVQRVLWGSTSTKNPSYSDIKYVAELIGEHTVNTVPDETWRAFLDHGVAKSTLTQGVEEAREIIAELQSFGIDINDVCAKLLNDGIKAFEKSFDSLLSTIEKKRSQM